MEGMGPFSGLPDLKVLVGESESETDMSPVAGTSIQVPLPNHIVKTEQTSLPKMEVVTSNASSPDNLVIDLPEDALPALSHKASVSVGDSVLRFREQAASTGSPRAGENGPAVSDPMAVMGLQILAEAVEERRMHPKLSSSPLPIKQHQLAAPLTPSSATSSLGIGQHLKVYPSASSAKHYIVKSHSNPNTDIVLRVQGTEVDITTTSSSAIQGDMSFGQSLPFPISTLSAPYTSHTLAEEDRGTAPPAPEEDLETMVQRFMAKYCEEVGDSHMTRVKDVPVKDLRHIIPLLIMNIYGSRADSSQKKSKVKGLWWKRPDDWPESVPFCDPNNSKRTTPDGSASKPKKETLSQMFDFLLKKYMEMQSMKGEFPLQSLISPMKTDSKADVRHIMGIVGDSRTSHQSSLDMLANVAVVNESHHSTYTGGPRPPKVMKLEQATASPTQTTLPQGLDLSTMKSNVGERTCARPIVKTFEVKRNGTTAAGSIRAISTHYNRASSVTRPVLEQRQPIIIRPVVPLTPRGPRISLNPRISSPATDKTLLKVENGASSGNSTHPSPIPQQVSSYSENNNVPQTVAGAPSLPINILPPASSFLSDPVPPPPRPVNSIEGDSVPVCPPLPPPSYVLEETPSLNPLLTSPSVKTSTQESPAVDLTKPKPAPVSHHSTCQEPVARESETESGDLVTPWDPVMDISNRLNSKVNYFDKNCVLPDQQRGLILIVRDTLRKMREVLSGVEGPSVHTFLDATHSFECTLDVAKVKKHIPEAECVRWHNFIAKWYIKVVRQSNEASCENG